MSIINFGFGTPYLITGGIGGGISPIPPVVVVPNYTVYQLIKLALGKIGRGTPGDALSPEDIEDGILNANILLDSWSQEDLLVYGPADYSINLTPGTNQVTIGPTGTYVTTRPIDIDSVYVVVSGISYSLGSITNEQYASIGLKDLQSNWPQYYNYENTMVNSTMKFYPAVSTPCTLYFKGNAPFQKLVARTDYLNWPPGYFRAFMLNLAPELADYYGMQCSPRTIQQALASKSLLKRNNYQPPMLSAVTLNSERGNTPYAYIVGGLF